MTDWTPPELPDGVPLFRALADALEADISSGALPPGTRLPSYRTLAEVARVDIGTVTRAYAEARARGLVEMTVGRGSFVADPASRPPPAPVELDLSMNLPPQPASAALPARLARALSAVTRRPDLSSLLNYQPAGGGEVDRAAGAEWLAPRLPDLTPARVLVTGGAQVALTALLSVLSWPGEKVLVDPFVYPGFRNAAQTRGLDLVAVEGDADGMAPDALARMARETEAQLVYLTPTIHNPMGTTMSLARREALLKVVAAHKLTVIEDDAYGMLADTAPPPLAALDPVRVWHLSTLSKGLTPGLRVAYLVMPRHASPEPIVTNLRSTAQMAPPLSVAVATRWIQDGTAQQILAAIRAEAMERQHLAAHILPPGLATGHPQGHHLWLTLPGGWTDLSFVAAAKRAGAALVPGLTFAIATGLGQHARVGLGAAPDRATLAQALERMAALLRHGPMADGGIV